MSCHKFAYACDSIDGFAAVPSFISFIVQEYVTFQVKLCRKYHVATLSAEFLATALVSISLMENIAESGVGLLPVMDPSKRCRGRQPEHRCNTHTVFVFIKFQYKRI